jgi:hypothetical protein
MSEVWLKGWTESKLNQTEVIMESHSGGNMTGSFVSLKFLIYVFDLIIYALDEPRFYNMLYLIDYMSEKVKYHWILWCGESVALWYIVFKVIILAFVWWYIPVTQISFLEMYVSCENSIVHLCQLRFP